MECYWENEMVNLLKKCFIFGYFTEKGGQVGKQYFLCDITKNYQFSDFYAVRPLSNLIV